MTCLHILTDYCFAIIALIIVCFENSFSTAYYHRKPLRVILSIYFGHLKPAAVTQLSIFYLILYSTAKRRIVPSFFSFRWLGRLTGGGVAELSAVVDL